jgi:hypothetical protein
MKAGELAGVRDLATDVAACIIPRFIVPPRAERDQKQLKLSLIDDVLDFSAAMARHWRDRPTFVDVTYVTDECGREKIGTWLPRMFERMRDARVRAIPLATLKELGKEESRAFRAALSSDDEMTFGLCISSGEMVGSFVADINGALDRMGLTPEQCVVVADFHDADFKRPGILVPIIGGAMEALQDMGLWQRIIFQGTNFPEKNPAEEGSHELWPRNEWIAWREAIEFGPSASEQMMFGDYAADCAKIESSGNGVAAIRHYRYATEGAWLVQRGRKSGTDKQIMQGVCKKIVDSEHFAGAGFSSADAYIFRSANNLDGPGNSTTWRQVNTTHHITRVVADIAKVRGIFIRERVLPDAGTQLHLLP